MDHAIQVVNAKELTDEMKDYLNTRFEQLAGVEDLTLELIKCFATEFNVSIGTANKLVTAWSFL